MTRFKNALVFGLVTLSILSSRNADAKNLGIAFGGGGFKSVADQVCRYNKKSVYAVISSNGDNDKKCCLN